MQLTLDFTPEPQREQKLIIQNEAWLDVSDIARGVGFTTAVQVNTSPLIVPGKSADIMCFTTMLSNAPVPKLGRVHWNPYKSRRGP